MAKRSKKKKVIDQHVSPPVSDFKSSLSKLWVPLLLAAITFLVYWPSLKFDFVYDARREILEEGFITSLSNLPDILSLKIIGTHLMLKDRPGQAIYMMLIAAIWGKEPFGYHLLSNFLHAVNVALLYVLLRRLIANEMTGLSGNSLFRAQLATVAVTLIFALHPIEVESISEVSYCACLLVNFFTLLALLMATAFRPENFRIAMITGGIGILCAFASIISKESGITTALMLIVYWFLFRRRERKKPWFWFLGFAVAITGAFLVTLFLLSVPNQTPISYLGGSFFQVFWFQPPLWVFMMGKILWPMNLSADYTLENVGDLSTSLALVILFIVVLLQVWLASKSRIGALVVAIYWLGLVTVSNFVPLFRPIADRFYYLPMMGVAMQLLALLLLLVKSRKKFYMGATPLLVAILPLAFLTITRENVFANELSLWSETIRISPFSSIAHNGLGHVYFENGKLDEAMDQFKKTLQINPYYVTAHNNLGLVYFEKGKIDEAIVEYRRALEINPNHAGAHYNLGIALSRKGDVNATIAQYEKTLEITPNDIDVRYNLGVIFMQKGQLDEAITQFQKALTINPGMAEARSNLGNIFFQKGQINEAEIQFKEALKINPNYAEAHNNLGSVLMQKGQADEALLHFQEAVRLKPDYSDAQDNLAKAKSIMQHH